MPFSGFHDKFITLWNEVRSFRIEIIFVNCKFVLTFNLDFLEVNTLSSNNQPGSDILLNTESKIFLYTDSL